MEKKTQEEVIADFKYVFGSPRGHDVLDYLRNYCYASDESDPFADSERLTSYRLGAMGVFRHICCILKRDSRNEEPQNCIMENEL